MTQPIFLRNVDRDKSFWYLKKSAGQMFMSDIVRHHIYRYLQERNAFYDVFSSSLECWVAASQTHSAQLYGIAEGDAFTPAVA